jgi:hypothetical protein
MLLEHGGHKHPYIRVILNVKNLLSHGTPPFAVNIEKRASTSLPGWMMQVLCSSTTYRNLATTWDLYGNELRYRPPRAS